MKNPVFAFCLLFTVLLASCKTVPSDTQPKKLTIEYEILDNSRCGITGLGEFILAIQCRTQGSNTAELYKLYSNTEAEIRHGFLYTDIPVLYDTKEKLILHVGDRNAIRAMMDWAQEKGLKIAKSIPTKTGLIVGVFLEDVNFDFLLSKLNRCAESVTHEYKASGEDGEDLGEVMIKDNDGKAKVKLILSSRNY